MMSYFSKGQWGNGRLLQLAVAVTLALVMVQPAVALDLFTLWQQPEIPLQITEGSWVEYRGQTMSGGRRKNSLTRIACLSIEDGSDSKSWLLEIYPLIERRDGTLAAEPGQGVRLRVSRDVLDREGSLMDGVTDVEQWQDGVRTSLSREQWINDPLIAVSMAGEFNPQKVETGSPNTRFVSGQQLLCDPFVFTQADTQSVVLPAGKMTQIRTHIITAAVNSEIPFLGLAYITEKVSAESKMMPPSKRFPDPMPSTTVEIMELIGFGTGAQPVFREGN